MNTAKAIFLLVTMSCLQLHADNAETNPIKPQAIGLLKQYDLLLVAENSNQDNQHRIIVISMIKGRLDEDSKYFLDASVDIFGPADTFLFGYRRNGDNTKLLRIKLKQDHGIELLEAGVVVVISLQNIIDAKKRLEEADPLPGREHKGAYK